MRGGAVDAAGAKWSWHKSINWPWRQYRLPADYWVDSPYVVLELSESWDRIEDPGGASRPLRTASWCAAWLPRCIPSGRSRSRCRPVEASPPERSRATGWAARLRLRDRYLEDSPVAPPASLDRLHDLGRVRGHDRRPQGVEWPRQSGGARGRWPGGSHRGLSLRLYNPQSRQWSLNFSNSRTGTLSPPAIGEFKDGRGEFFAQESLDGRAILVRFVISDITPTSGRFEQSSRPMAARPGRSTGSRRTLGCQARRTRRPSERKETLSDKVEPCPGRSSPRSG